AAGIGPQLGVDLGRADAGRVEQLTALGQGADQRGAGRGMRTGARAVAGLNDPAAGDRQLDADAIAAGLVTGLAGTGPGAGRAGADGVESKPHDGVGMHGTKLSGPLWPGSPRTARAARPASAAASARRPSPRASATRATSSAPAPRTGTPCAPRRPPAPPPPTARRPRAAAGGTSGS